MVDRSLGEVRLARTDHARAAGRVSAGERHSVACLLAAERARHRVAVHLDGQEVREEARRLRRFRKATIDVKSTELVAQSHTRAHAWDAALSRGRYVKSKVEQERAALAFAEKEGLDMRVVVPGNLCIGPISSKKINGTMTRIKDIMSGKNSLKGAADLAIVHVNVRRRPPHPDQSRPRIDLASSSLISRSPRAQLSSPAPGPCSLGARRTSSRRTTSA